jgi:uncharacterized protein DUF6985
MFGLFKSPPFRDAQLGELSRSRGLWRGMLMLESGTSVPLAVSGNRSQPDAQALALARQVDAQFPSWRSAIETALFEHYAPYAEALAAGERSSPGEPFPKIESPSQVWPFVSAVYVAVTPLDGVFTTEIGYTTIWDEEHTVGARFQSGRFIDLCGSVLRP